LRIGVRIVGLKNFVAVAALSSVISVTPAAADEAFDIVWAGLHKDEKALVDRLAADLSNTVTGKPTKVAKGARLFMSLSDRDKARFRAEALEQLGVLVRQGEPQPSPTSREV
jgi:hypothetical protein